MIQMRASIVSLKDDVKSWQRYGKSSVQTCQLVNWLTLQLLRTSMPKLKCLTDK